jgi:hypothetical protein
MGLLISTLEGGTAIPNLRVIYFMYDLRITLPTTQDERACLYLLLRKLESNQKFRLMFDSAILMPLFQRILDKSMSGVMLDPFCHTEYDEYDFAKDIEKLFKKYNETKL